MGGWGNGTNVTLFNNSSDGVVWINFHDSASRGLSTSLSIEDKDTKELLSADMTLDKWKLLRKDIDEAIKILETN